MKHFYIILNPYKKAELVEMAEKISQYLESRGCICHMPERMEKADGDHTGYRYTDSGMVPENVECVITLGGDGTLIQAARDLAGRQIPMLGINMGTLGYLTQISGAGGNHSQISGTGQRPVPAGTPDDVKRHRCQTWQGDRQRTGIK